MMELALLMLSAAAFPVQVQFFQLLARLYLLSSQNNCESKSKRMYVPASACASASEVRIPWQGVCKSNDVASPSRMRAMANVELCLAGST